MHCADLDRYLEAHLDGRLGRTRAASLRRHLAVCGSCRRRVLVLDAFAREVAEHVSSRCGETVWSSLLTPDVHQATLGPPVALALPPPLPGRRSEAARDARLPVPPLLRDAPPAPSAAPSRVRRVLLRGAGFLVLFAALGTVFQLVSGVVAPSPPPPATGSLASVPEPAPPLLLDIETGDPAVLAAWFEGVLGEAYPVPAAPAGFELLGGRREWVAGQPLAAVVYRRSPDVLTLYVTPRTGGPDLRALAPSSWAGSSWVFGIAGNWRERDLEAFRAATAHVPGQAAAVAR